MSTTIGDLVDRVFLEWLAVPDDQVSQSNLANALDASSTTFVIADVLTPEEEALIGAGTVLEIDQELLRTTDYNDTTRTVTAFRGVLGTTAATHAQYAPVLVAPSFSRKSVFDALGDSIMELYPDLWGVSTTDVMASKLVDFSDTQAVAVLNARFDRGDRWVEVPVEFVSDWPDSSTGTALLFPDSDVWGTTVFVTYRYKFTRPTSEATTMASLGLDTGWERLIIVSTAAAVLAGQEIEQTTMEFLTSALERSGMPFGEITNVATQLVRYRLLLLQQAKRALTARYRTPVHVRQPY